MAQRRAHYVLSTHWDREWYQTFQDYRYRLVQLIDRILDGWKREDLQGPFQMDGQAITLEDYLEIRPERKQQVEELVREGKFILGPWYVLPDEFLVSGESLVRNLRLGGDLVKQIGGNPSKAGFMCDMFGHNSQMPQIFEGFGIKAAFIWRGTNLIDTHLISWRGADGTVIPCYRFGDTGYCSYSVDVRRCRPESPEVAENEFPIRLDEFLQKEKSKTSVGPLMVFDGCDHLEWDPQSYAAVLKRTGKLDQEIELVHSSLDQYIQDLLPYANQITAELEGELREPGLYPMDVDKQWLIPGVLSSRVWIKQANARCQDLLCSWAEPWSVISKVELGQEYPSGYLNTAWKWLITNHPHDSMCGCSIDAVHEDMRYRFNQSQRIAERVTIEKTRSLAASVEGSVGEQELRLVVFNPTHRPFQQSGDVELMIPTDWPIFNEFFGFEPKPAFKLYDFNGEEIPYQRLSQTMNQKVVETYDTQFPRALKRHKVEISFPMEIPPFGYSTYTIKAGQEGIPTRYPSVPGLATSNASMENEILSVDIDQNGSLIITDKRNGASYKRNMIFEDSADIGDGWYHGQAVNDQVFSSVSGRASVALVHNGPMVTTFRIRVEMKIPEEFNFSSMVRSDHFQDLVIDNFVSLRPGCDFIEVETIIQNHARDHRLKVLFPSECDADTYLADSPFDVVERPVALRKDNHLYRELEVEEKPQQTWSAVYSDGRGLAFVSSGLLESAVRNIPEKPLAVTLFRSTRKTVMTNDEPLGQLQGELRFKYFLLALNHAPDRVRLSELGTLLGAGLRDIQLTAEQIKRKKTGVDLPAQNSYLSIKGSAIISSIQIVENRIELRLVNPNQQTENIAVNFSSLFKGKGVWWNFVDLESKDISTPVKTWEGEVELTLRPKQILTLALREIVKNT